MGNYANYLVYCGRHQQLIGDLKTTVLPYDLPCPLCGLNPDSTYGMWKLYPLGRCSERAVMRCNRSHFAVKSHRVGVRELLAGLGFKNGLERRRKK